MKKKDLLKIAELFALSNKAEFGQALLNKVMAKLFGLKDVDKRFILDLQPEISQVIEKINKLSKEEVEARLSELKQEEKGKARLKKRKARKGLPELAEAKRGKVVMRLAPFPSGPLHIGNARPYVLNDEYVKHYQGKLLLVIDDTIGSEEKQIVPEAYKLIPEGLKWLQIKWQEPIIYKSDRLEIYYSYAYKLIEAGHAYVCFCSHEQIKENRAKARSCKCREHSVKENLEYFDEMLSNRYKAGEAVLRIKTSMQHPNPAFRDRVLLRISDRKHPRTEAKIWPLLEFSWAIDDYLLGITHVLRGKELMIETDMERYLFKLFGWKEPIFIHTGLLQFKDIKISKSKSRQEVLSGKYFGWDDPRTWSLQSLAKRGLLAEAIRKFCLSFGLTQHEITVPVEILYKENRKLLDPVAKRFFFINDPVQIKIKSAPTLKAELPLHPQKPEMGKRIFTCKDEFLICKQDYELIKNAPDGTMFRFMDLFNWVKQGDEFIFHSVQYNKELKAKLIHFLPANEKLIKVKVLMPDASLKQGLGEKGLAELNQGEIIQFERFGFCRLNEVNKELVFWYAHP